jgi:small-conductance mechanosensitive channel
MSAIIRYVAPMLLLLALALGAPEASAQAVPGLTATQGGAEAPAEGDAVDPVDLLLEILQDEEARARLLERLEATGAEPLAAEVAEERPGIATLVSSAFREFVEGTRERVAEWVELVRGIPNLLSGITAQEIELLVEVLELLLLTIAVTWATFIILRSAAMPLYRRMGVRAGAMPLLRKIVPFLAAAVIDLLILAISGSTGVIVARVFFAGSVEGFATQLLYLFAFFAVGLCNAALRLLLSPATGGLRPLNLSDWAARRLYRVARITVSTIGYGFLLVMPVVEREAGFYEARSTAIVIWLLVIVHLAAMVLHYRRPVGDWLLQQTGRARWRNEPTGDPAGTAPAAAGSDVPASRFLRGLAHAWYWVALFWLGWLLVTVMQGRRGSIAELMGASGRVALALMVVFVLSAVIGNVMRRGISLPQGLSRRVPLLETRLNYHVPRGLFVIRVFLLLGVVFYAIETLDFLDIASWQASQLGLRLVSDFFGVVLIVLGAFLVWLALTSWVDYRLNPDFGDAPTAREQTLFTLLKNAATVLIIALALMFSLSEIGLNIGPLLASAGVVGLAIGFGAQKMVEDIISGAFIQFENAINVGDVVSAGGITGSVERLSVRSVSLRDLSGIFHIIPFSSVGTVSNYTRDFSYYVIDMGVAYRENVPEVKQAMHDAFDELRMDPERGAFVLGDLDWFGLDAFGDNAVVLKCRVKTWPGQQWGIGRAYNEILKRVFDERGIEIPFPQRTLWHGEPKGGHPAVTPARIETSPLHGDDAAPGHEED